MIVDASIIVTTYNHAPYISLCFRSILEQTTSRKLQIIWHDDASTDETLILGEMELLHCPHEIVRIHRKTNRMSRRVPIILDALEYCGGEYIFTVDGDDFWVDPNKIDLQIDTLVSHPEFKICFTPAFFASGAQLEVQSVGCYYSDTRTAIPLDQVILGDGGFMPTASVCVRRQVFESAPPWFFGYKCVGDYPLQVLASSPAGAMYLPNITCVYRTNIEGSWTTEILRKIEASLTFEVEILELLLNMHNTLPGHKDAFISVALQHFNNLCAISIKNNELQSLEKALLIIREIK